MLSRKKGARLTLVTGSMFVLLGSYFFFQEILSDGKVGGEFGGAESLVFGIALALGIVQTGTGIYLLRRKKHKPEVHHLVIDFSGENKMHQSSKY